MPIPTIVGVGAQANSAAAITPAYPAGYTATTNDIGVTFIECHTTDTITPPTGWALIQSSNVSTGTAPTKLSAFWRRIQSGDTAPQYADAGDHMVGRMIVIRGCVTSGNPWDFAIASSETTADTTVSIAAGTTTVPNCLVMAAFSTGQDTASTAGATAWANVSLSSVAEQMDNWTSNGTGGGFSMATGGKATAGSTGTTTATLSLTANFKAQLLIAFKGAPITAAVGTVTQTNTALAINPVFTDAARVAEVVWYNEDSTQPLTVSKPASFASGQVLVAIIHQHGTSDTALTTPSGWTQVGTSINGTNSQAKVFSHSFNAGDPSSWDFGYGVTADVCLVLFRIVGADTTPVVSNTNSTSASLTGSFDSPTITPAGNKDLLICTIGDICSGSLFSVNVPTGMVDWGKTQAATSFMALAAATKQLRSSSATGAQTWTSVSPTGVDGGSFSVVVKTASAGGISQAIGTATETDTAQTLNRVKTKAVGTVTQTNTAQQLNRVKTKAVLLITETDTAQTINRRKSKTVTFASETDNVFNITRLSGHDVIVGTITETDTAQSISSRKTRFTGMVTETDAAQSINRRKNQSVQVATSTNTAVALVEVKSKLIGTVTNTQTALNITKRKFSPVLGVTETELARPITRVKSAVLGIASSSNTAITISGSKKQVVGLIAETDASGSITNPSAPHIAGTVTETDTARPITTQKTRSVGISTSANTALAINESKSKSIGVASSTQTALNIVRFIVPIVVHATSSNTAMGIAGGRATLDTHGWMPLVGHHGVYLLQKTVGGNTTYVKRISVTITGFASDGYPILKSNASGVTYGNASVGIRPRSHPDSNEVGVYVSY